MRIESILTSVWLHLNWWSSNFPQKFSRSNEVVQRLSNSVLCDCRKNRKSCFSFWMCPCMQVVSPENESSLHPSGPPEEDAWRKISSHCLSYWYEKLLYMYKKKDKKGCLWLVRCITSLNRPISPCHFVMEHKPSSPLMMSNSILKGKLT